MITKQRLKSLERKLASIDAGDKKTYMLFQDERGYTYEGNFYKTLDEFKQENKAGDNDTVICLWRY